MGEERGEGGGERGREGGGGLGGTNMLSRGNCGILHNLVLTFRTHIVTAKM